MNLTHTQTIFKLALLFVVLTIPLLWFLSQRNIAASIIELQQNSRDSFGEILNI
ncbi:hypothetical protein ACFL1U_01250 [Patescibacteria group bacterium]